MKNKETLEEAKYRLYKEHWNEDHTQLVKSNFLNGFDEGVKWKRERMYSEEDMREAFNNGAWRWRMHSKIDIFKEWLKTFKKK